MPGRRARGKGRRGENKDCLVEEKEGKLGEERDFLVVEQEAQEGEE